MIFHRDCLELMFEIDDNEIDAVVTDPPYGLAFMNRAWDKALPDPRVWVELRRTMKPGAHGVIFGAPRLYHRLACSVEDAGLEIRDVLQWLFGSGFPKGGNTTDEHGILLKPAYEPILLVRKPLEGTVAQNVLKWGTGCLNIGACRVGADGGTKKSNPVRGSATQSAYGRGLNGGGCEPIDAGRWPANVILDEAAGAILDEQSGTLKSGSASRFFYCAKASRAEREAGLEHLPARNVTDGRAVTNDTAYQRGATQRRNTHPTVKPIDLMRWLVRLITPEGGTVFDPFAGSGSTGVACALEGVPFIGAELEEEYVRIGNARIAHHERAGTCDV